MTAWKVFKRNWNDLARGLPRSKGLVWWLIEKEGAWWIQGLSPMLFLFLFTVCFWLPLRDAGKALSLGFALILQMYLHELGHLFVFRQNRIRSRVWWLFPLGAVAAPVSLEENAKNDALPWGSIAWLLQAGVTLNVGMMCVGSMLQTVPIRWLADFGGDMLLAGGILVISNLIPLWKLDGSLLYHVIFSSLKEKEDIRVALGLLTAMVLAILAAFWSISQLGFWELVVAFFRRMGWFVVIPVIATGIWHRQGMDDPTYSTSTQAMTRRQSIIHILLYIALLYLSLRLILGPLLLNF